MNKTIVFDFDKTLTYKDSLREIFMQEMRGLKYPLRLVYVFLALLSKLSIISVRQEKEWMIGLLFRSNDTLFESKCIEQARTIELNPIFKKIGNYVTVSDRVIILSASAVYLLDEIFKDLNIEIIGTTFICEKGKIKNINQHPFGKEKYNLLIARGITDIDEMFYDSHYDECLIPLCKKWNKVKDGVIIETKQR